MTRPPETDTDPTRPGPLDYAPPPGLPARIARWVRAAVLVVAALVLLTVAGVDLMLRVGPTRPAVYRGKRTTAATATADRGYRVSYTYDDHGRWPSETDRVTYPMYLQLRPGSPLRVRTFGFGTFRFARLVGGGTRRADLTAAAGWAGVAVSLAALGVGRLLRRRRRQSPAAT